MTTRPADRAPLGETANDECPACGHAPAYTPPDYPCPHFTVRFQAASDWSAEQAFVSVKLTDGKSAGCQAYGSELKFRDVVTEPSVNWSAFGTQCAEDSRRYGELLRYAAALAGTLTPSGKAAAKLAKVAT